MKEKFKDPQAVEKAILAGDVEAVTAFLDTGEILFKKGKTVELKNNIPRTYISNGETHTIYIDAFNLALSNRQTEIVKLLIDSGAVDLGPGSDKPFMAIRAGQPEIFSYMLEKGMHVDRREKWITRLFLNVAEKWDEKWLSIIQDMELPIKECGGPSLCYCARDGRMELAEFFLSAGVSVNCRDTSSHSTPVLCAAEAGHFDMVKLLVERGADLSLKDDMGVRPYIAAQTKHNAEMAAYIKAHEPEELHSEEAQERLFEAYHVPKAMREYLKNGNLKLEFPEEEKLHWVKLFSYMDVPEIAYRGKRCLSLVEDSEDYGVMLLWEPGTRKIWFLDMEHDVFHALATWTKFFQNAGRYLNRAIMWEFD